MTEVRRQTIELRDARADRCLSLEASLHDPARLLSVS